MNLISPFALWWLLLAVPVVVFYVLKIRLKRVPVSTVIFWRQIFDEKKPRSLWQRLRHLVSLLVQLALLAMLVAALAEPFFSWEAAGARRVVLVVDNSASMAATDVAPSRLERAKEEAAAVIRGLRPRDELAIVAVSPQPRVVCGLTGHHRTLLDALAGIPQTDGPSPLAAAAAVARRLAADTDGGGKEPQVVVVTDGCGEAAPAAADVRVVAVGEKVGNVGITRFQARRSTLDPIGYEVLIEVANQSDDPTGDFRLVLKLNDHPLDVVPLNLPPNGKWSKTIDSTTADGGRLTAELVVKGEKGDAPYPDALAADNTAVAVLPKREPMPVHLHSPAGNWFLENVLRANPLVNLTVGKQLADAPPPGAVVVYHREVPKTLPPGNVLVIDPANGCDLWAVGDKLANPIVTQQDKDSPVMAHVRLDNVLMPEAHKLTFTPAAGKPRVLAGVVTGDPVFAQIDRPSGPVVVLTVDLDKGELPFRTAFPILATNALALFAGGAGELREAVATGATADVNLPATGQAFELVSPDGSVRKLPAGAAKATAGPFDRCGVWAVTADGKPIEEVAVNLMNRAESDLRPTAPEAPPATAADAGLTSGLLGRPVWWYLTAAGFLLVALEWYLYQRRWIS
ncbi:MAG: BatA and WFA domain-containing protein [Gemmataceae bacterium]|nr:BatA and WFA domain-containing protein [Gemmataceae bacterium]